MEIDLGKKPENYDGPKVADKPSKKVYYPTTYISGLGDVDLEAGQEVTLKGEVISVTVTTRNGKTTYSCDIEVRKLECEDCEEGLDGAMKKIAAKKTKEDYDD